MPTAGSHVALTSGDQPRGKIRIIDLQNRAETNLMLPHEWWIASLSWAADGKALFAAAQSLNYFITRIELDGRFRQLLEGGRDRWLSSVEPESPRVPRARRNVSSSFTTELTQLLTG
jgi:hypothetical protein